MDNFDPIEFERLIRAELADELLKTANEQKAQRLEELRQGIQALEILKTAPFGKTDTPRSYRKLTSDVLAAINLNAKRLRRYPFDAEEQTMLAVAERKIKRLIQDIVKRHDAFLAVSKEKQ